MSKVIDIFNYKQLVAERLIEKEGGLEQALTNLSIESVAAIETAAAEFDIFVNKIVLRYNELKEINPPDIDLVQMKKELDLMFVLQQKYSEVITRLRSIRSKQLQKSDSIRHDPN